MESPRKIAGRSAVWVAAATIVLATFIAYRAAVDAPFLFDDRVSIVDNPTIRHFATAFSPPAGGLPVSGRPIVNATLALNYATNGLSPRGYHLGNIALHALAALVLFGLVRRTALRWHSRTVRPRATVAASSWFFATATALLWTVHPLATEAVTYVVQRAEVLVALFYLLTLYAFVRSMEHDEPIRASGRSTVVAPNPRRTAWLTVSWIACLFGMATKEVMVSAPIIVLLFDRGFVSGSFAAAWQRRRTYYIGLGATWLMLGSLVATTGTRGGTAGFGINITPVAYALTQCQAIVRYIGLAIWPTPLVFDYNTYLAHSFFAIAPFALLSATLVGLTFAALRRGHIGGFFGAAFFAILAPSSSIVPVATQTIAEHRMYLPLAVMVVGGMAAAASLLQRRPVIVLMLAAVGLLELTMARNRTYSRELSLWWDTMAKRPDNVRARYNVALAALAANRPETAMAQSRAAIQIEPTSADAHYNFALVLLRLGRRDEATQECAEALRFRPTMAEAQSTWGVALLTGGKLEDARAHFMAALKLDPVLFEARDNLGTALLQLDRIDEAAAEFAAAIRLRSDNANAHHNYADALRQLGRLEDARGECDTALRLQTDFAEARATLGHILLQQRKLGDAVREYETALRLNSDLPEAHLGLAGALLQLGRTPEGFQHYEEALRLNPDSYAANFNFANALLQLGHYHEAATHYAAAVRGNPNAYSAQYNLGHALAGEGNPKDAIVAFRAALQTKPDSIDAQFALGAALLETHEFDAAWRAFDAVLQAAPNSPEAHCGAADALLQLGRADEAASHYATAVRLKPNYLEANQKLAQLRQNRAK